MSDDPNVVIDNDLFKVTLIEKLAEPEIGYRVLIENKSNQYIRLDIRNSSADGVMTDFNFKGGNSSVAPGKKLETEICIENKDLKEKISKPVKNVEGSFTIATNTDGGLHWSGLRDAYPFVIPDNETGTEAGEISAVGTDSSDVTQTDYVKVEGIYADNSWDSDIPMKLVYVFADMFTNDENLEVSSEGSELTINGVNSYSADVYLNRAKTADNYYYDNLSTPLYLGDSKKVLLTFLIPATELEANRTITMNLYGIPDTDKIKMNTNDIIFCDSEDEIVQKADPEGYARVQLADAETTEKVKQALNGNRFVAREVGGRAVEIYAFKSPDKFESIMEDGTALFTGNYTIENGYIVCKIEEHFVRSGVGRTARIPWKWGDNGIELDFPQYGLTWQENWFA